MPARFPYQEAREFFKEAETVDTKDLKFEWKEPDWDGLNKFLVTDFQFSPERVQRFMDRLKAAKSKTKQKPLDSFFKVAAPVVKESDKFDPTAKKRGAPKAKGKAPPAKRGRR